MNKMPTDTFIKRYLKSAKEVLAGFKKINYAFVFGSCLKEVLPESDVDILIGGSLSFSEKVDLAAQLEFILKMKVDIVLTEEADAALVAKAFSNGVSLLINNKEALKKDYFKNLYRYENNLNLRSLRSARIKRRYGNG